MIHSTFRELGRKTISFSLIAFDRSIEVDLSPRKGVRPVCGGRCPMDLLGIWQVISRDSRVFEHSTTSLIINERCSSPNHPKVSFRKWMPLGRDSNRRATGFIPPLWRSSRDPVNGGGFESWAVVDGLPSDSASTITVRSSRRGNEKMRSRNLEVGQKIKTTRIDLIAGENPWNGAKVTVAQ